MQKFSIPNSPVKYVLLAVTLILICLKSGLAHKPLQSTLEKNSQANFKQIILFDKNKRININNNNILSLKKSPLSKDHARAVVTSFLRQNKQKLDIRNELTDFKLEKISKSPAGIHLYYQEMRDGIPVYNAKIAVSLDQTNEISFISRNYQPGHVNPNNRIQISETDVLNIAHQYLGVSDELRGEQKTEQVIFHSKINGAVFAYRVEIPSKKPLGDWEIFIDSQSGEIIQAKNLLIYKSGTDGQGAVWDPDPLTTKKTFYGGDYTDNNDQDHDSLNAQRVLVTLPDLYTDEQGKYVLEGPYVKLADKDLPFDEFPALSHPDSFIYTRQEQEFEAVMVYYHIDKSYRRLLELGFFTEDTALGLLEFEVDPHGNNGLDNSYYSPFLNYCSFGEGGVDDAEDAAVIWHEYAHAIQFNISNISSDVVGETRSLIEGCSDYWAASYNRRLSDFAWNHVFLWDAGIQSEQGDTTFWAGRRCDLDWKYSKEDSATYAGTHYWGQIWSSALMRIWDDLGAEITDKLFIASHYYWGAQPNFRTAAEAIIQADIDIYNGQHLTILLSWFEYFNFIDTQNYQAQISHDPINDLDIRSDIYQIKCQIIPSVAALDTTDLWLIWTTDSIFADSIRLLTDSTEYWYTADIPTVEEPSSIKYYFHARDSLDMTSVLPVEAPLDYFSFYDGPDSLPPPPNNVQITDSIDIVDLSWHEIITGKQVSYNIYRKENDLEFNKIDSTLSSSYSDTTVAIGNRYFYYVTTVFNKWEGNPSDTVDVMVQAITSLTKDNSFPDEFRLYQNYPNPFNPITIINYEIPISNYVDLSIYNLLGQKVAILVSERQSAGSYKIEWDASGFASGIYYYKIESEQFIDVKKMILLR